MQKIIAMTAALCSSVSLASEALPPEWVIQHYEADKLEESGDVDGASSKRKQAHETKDKAFAAYERTRGKKSKS